MIYYLIIEDLLNLYLHKTFIDSSTMGGFFCLFQIILFSYLSIYPHFSNILRRNLFCFIYKSYTILRSGNGHIKL